MLPNLTGLKIQIHGVCSIDTRKRDNESEGGESKPLKRTCDLLDIDWYNWIRDPSSRQFTVIVPDVQRSNHATTSTTDERPKAEWKLTFSVGKNIMSMLVRTRTETSKSCVEVKFSTYFCELEDLFDELAEDDLPACMMEYSQNDADTIKGYGAAVIHMLSALAHKCKIRIQLEDNARFRRNPVFTDPSSKLKNPYVEMTGILCLIRGYGYYEGYGFVSRVLYNSVSSNNEMYLLRNAWEIDLKWTHMIATTPAAKLQKEIRNFYEIANRVAVPAITTQTYSQAACAAYAEKALTNYVQPYEEVFKNADVDWLSLSMREILIKVSDKTIDSSHYNDLNDAMSSLITFVWCREREGTITSYPGPYLVMPYNKRYVVVENENLKEPPILQERQIREDLKVQYIDESMEGEPKLDEL